MATRPKAPARTNAKLYRDLSPDRAPLSPARSNCSESIDAYARGKDKRVRRVTVALLRRNSRRSHSRDSTSVGDIRPLVRLNVAIVVGEGDRQESGSHGVGGRSSYDVFIEPAKWRPVERGAARLSSISTRARRAGRQASRSSAQARLAASALHEAVGHGLEGDFNRKQTSAFAGLMGQQVAAKGVTVVDDGTIQSRRGSLSIDDEGTPTNRTVLIEDGILVGYMQDRQNARLMNMKPTGNGRRQSHAHVPMPRMTNTIMLASGKATRRNHQPRSNRTGLYAVTSAAAASTSPRASSCFHAPRPT